MNLILLFPDDLTTPGHARLEGRRLAHVREVHRAEPGDVLRVGLLDGAMGLATVEAMGPGHVDLVLDFSAPQAPPPKLPLVLVAALPRPKVLNRLLVAATSLGVRSLHLVHACRVEKAYWGSPRLSEANLLEQRMLGLEQARDTVLPDLHLHRRFRPFVEDVLPGLTGDGPLGDGPLGDGPLGDGPLGEGLRLVAHPGPFAPCPRAVTGPVTLVVGPEGGFVPFEVELLQAQGFQPVDLGPRILRVETAVTALVGRLF